MRQKSDDARPVVREMPLPFESLPPEAPIAMPVQNFRKAPARTGRASVINIDSITRRILLLSLSIIPALLAANEMQRSLGSDGYSSFELGYVALFIPLFAWIAFGFATSLIGFIQLWSPRPRIRAYPQAPVSGLEGRTAVLVPVCNEDFLTVLSRLSIMERSLIRVMGSERFEFFILSDSNAENGMSESEAYRQIRDSFHRPVHYRRRARNIGRKPGNIADWVQRFGGGYDYMIVLDADSVMSGQTMVRLAIDMERHPELGLVQTVPVVAGASTFFQHWQRFANRLYGPISAAGMIWWSASEGTFWGHNAIIRTRAFAESCGLPELWGPAPFGGHIMSHDMVEAALLRRNGWAVHMVMAEDSYEEFPPSLPDLAVRDRRWCQGNIQHVPLLLRIAGLHPVNRFQLLVGASAYLTSPLWLTMIVVVMAGELAGAWTAGGILPSDALLCLTLLMLFGPKLLALGWALANTGRRAGFGGAVAMIGSVILDTLLSILMAPVSMLTQTINLIGILIGRKSAWSGQSRDRDGLPFWGSVWTFRYHVALGGAILYAGHISTISMVWLVPIIFGLIGSPFLAALTARKDLGIVAERANIFRVPEAWWRMPDYRPLRLRLSVGKAEVAPPPVIVANDA